MGPVTYRWIGRLMIFAAGICLLASPVLAAEAMENGLSGAETVVTVTISDSGREVSLKKGDLLRVELETYGTAGYSWEFEGLDGEYLRIVAKESKPRSGLMGAPNLMKWDLKAMKPGVTKVVMYNYRIWEGKDKSVSRFLLGVKIE